MEKIRMFIIIIIIILRIIFIVIIMWSLVSIKFICLIASGGLDEGVMPHG